MTKTRRGFSQIPSNAKRSNVPKKIERLKALGLLAPSLLRKVVDMRNILEHEYSTPELEKVEDALDIASLFVMSASAIFIPLMTS
ncbi:MULTISPECIES: hypothetical protein [unclassified Pseudomonas]|uniref:hypothetical protein n=1 Tax=unclassified Pseudomonas TaxID=196821 RepID=UPI000BC59249|nr:MULTISPECIES: hypothetical protein [unclassified Pseudomonas]PVZ20475.1 hypothetical protein F474_01075 [Pseudomonas sp. URIL14HWK12:I12]PVZ27541.1 hypothetical protein F470_00730 [Pseudomonas sp. URIL14HWK12:I10]PVZ38430.1 hypothetical protein F472_01075 [Pseudomonas sp. URIL14HWK12:I11]SNZ03388.1 hypothetical protein SAMN05660463_00329 [Pseudomonas sp. URIL14HWK12:I9]